MPYTQIPLYRCNLHFGLPAARRCGSIRICEAAVLFAKGAAVRSGPTCFACHVTLLDMCSHPCTCGHAVSHTFDVSHSSLGL